MKTNNSMTRITKMENKAMDGKVTNGRFVVALMLTAGLLMSASKAQAAFSQDDAGTKTGQFLKLPVGARIIGMGEAGTAIADDANAIFYNVAGLNRLEKKSAEYMYSGIFLKDKAGDDGNAGQHWIAFAMPISETIGSAGIALQLFDAGDITKTDIRAAKQGTFNPRDLAVNLSYARMMMDIPLGINLKIINSKIEESATTVAVDLGMQYTKLMDEKLALGFAVQNLGGELKFENEGDNLPIIIRFGSGYYVSENWVAALDLVFPQDNSAVLGFGTDYKHMIQEDMAISGRIGYNTRNRRIDGFTGLRFGIGFQFQIATLDYAWEPMGDLATAHRISLGVKF